MSSEEQIELLKETISRLEGQVHALQEALTGDITPHVAFGLTPTEATIFSILVHRGKSTKTQIWNALYGLRPDDGAEMKIVDVLVCKARKKLSKFGIRIETLWGFGYAIPAESLARVREILDGTGDDVRGSGEQG